MFNKDFATKTDYIGFEPFEKDGKTYYRTYNLIERRIHGRFIKEGLPGGQVEKPELIANDDIWVARGAEIYGDTTIEGTVYIKEARIYDATIKGNVWIGSEKKEVRSYRNDNLYQEAVLVRIANSVLDSGEDEEDMIYVEARAYIKNSVIKGATTLSDHVHVIESQIVNGYLIDYAFVTKSVLIDSSMCDSTHLHKSTLKNSDATGEVVIERSEFDGQKFKGSTYYHDGETETSYRYVKGVVA